MKKIWVRREYIREEEAWPGEEKDDAEEVQTSWQDKQDESDFCVLGGLLLLSSKPNISIICCIQCSICYYVDPSWSLPVILSEKIDSDIILRWV